MGIVVAQIGRNKVEQRLGALRARTQGRGIADYECKKLLIIPQFKSNKNFDIDSQAIKPRINEPLKIYLSLKHDHFKQIASLFNFWFCRNYKWVNGSTSPIRFRNGELS